MKKAIFFLFAALVALVSCNREMDSPEDFVKGKVTFKASIVETKTHLGAKEGTSWPNYWSTSDVISVNGVVSEPLDASFDGSASAKFTVDGVAAPFFAAYPASAVSAYADGAATIQIPAEQLFVDGSYDPEAYIMLGKSTGDDLAFVPQMAIFSITPTGEEGTLIRSVSLTSLGDKKIAGSFTTDFESLTAGTDAVSTVTVSALEGIDVGKTWMIAIPASDFTAEGIKIVITDADGGCMTRTAVPSKAYVAGKMYSVSIPYAADPLSLTVEGITSSTAVICWSTSPDSAYTINVYSDAGCSALVDSYSIDAGNSCWGGKAPRFCVSGLAAGTTYYVKVTNDDLSVESDVLPFTTEAFTVVEVSESPAAIGDVILAEDFGELRWDCDMIGVGAGWFPTSAAQASFSTVEIGSFQAAATSSEKQISAQTSAVAASRLAHWAQGENPHMYVHPGYIKLVGQKKVTHLVTPALDNIPEGKLATLDVEVTASAYYSESSGSYCTTDAVIAVQTEEISNELAGGTESVNTLDLSTNVQPITLDEATAWKSYKVTLTGVGKGARLAFGAASNVTGNDARMNISDIKVTITDLEEPGLEASSKAVSSSTAAFTWTYGGEAAADIAKPYTIALYSDSSCSNLVVSYDIEADHSCWNGKTPSFVFSGLNPSTEYWFIATDTEANVSSDPVSATTEAFTVVDATTVTTAAVDDIILAEDFSEVMWGGDLPNASAGYNGDESVANSMTSREASKFVAGATTTTELLLAKNVYNTEGLRLRNWAQGKNNIYMHPGYIKISTSSTNNAHIITPALNSLPADKLATLEVTITAAGWGSNYKAVAAVQHSNAADILNMSESSGQSNTVAFDNFSQITLNGGTQKWSTQTITVSGVQKGDRIAVGSTETVAKGEGRMMISDIVIKVKELVSNEHESLEISDFATLKAFLTSCASLPAANGTVTADITLTDEQEADIAALYPIPVYDATLEGGGFTISGLKKPFINILKGPVSNLTLNSVLNIEDSMNNIGILAGSVDNAAISGCVTNGSVTFNCESAVGGDFFISGMVGKINGGTMTNCVNNANVVNATSSNDTASGIIAMGGITGHANSVTFSKCINNGAVSNSGVAGKNDTYCRIGGLVGWADGVNLSASGDDRNINYGDVDELSDSNDSAFAGIVAYAEGEVSDFSNCRNEGKITVGGSKKYIFFGGIAGAFANSSIIDNTFNSGLITASGASLASSGYLRLGGILGGWFNAACTSQTISGCTNTGDITITSDNLALHSSGTKPDCYVGGIAGGGSNGGVCGKALVNCTNSGDITLNGGSANSGKLYHMFCIGGIVGYTDVNPTGSKCIADIRVRSTKGTNRVGGIAGEMMISEIHDVTYKGTVNTNGCSGTNFTGGLVGNIGTGERTFTRCTISGTSRGPNSEGAGAGIFFSCNGGGTGPTVNIASCTVGSGTRLQSASSGYLITITSADQITAENICGTNGSTRKCTTGTNDGLSVVVDPDTITL